MKHYPHHIGDFDRATRHLTRIERSVYRDLIDQYYDTEQQLTLDKAALCRKILARSNEESTAVEQVLTEFFTETPTGWFHARCEEEIAAYRANNSQKAQAGKASAAAKALKKQLALNGALTPVQQPLKSVDGPVEQTNNGASTNQQPSTNQPIGESASAPPTPLKPKKPPKAQPIDKPDDVDPQVWADWLQLRKAKKAPVTLTVLHGAIKEAAKAEMSLEDFLRVWCRRGSQGLEADWLKPEERAGTVRRFLPPQPNETVPSRPDRDPELVRIEREAKSAAPAPAAVRQQLAGLTAKLTGKAVA